MGKEISQDKTKSKRFEMEMAKYPLTPNNREKKVWKSG